MVNVLVMYARAQIVASRHHLSALRMKAINDKAAATFLSSMVTMTVMSDLMNSERVAYLARRVPIFYVGPVPK